MSTAWMRFALVLLGWLPLLPGATVTLLPVADTSVTQAYPGNNLGAQTFLIAGTTQTYLKTRALLRFDPAGQIPAGAQITSVQLVLTITTQPSDGYTPTAFGLHRMLTNWTEGTKSGYPPLLGAPAGTNETCWNERLYGVSPWTLPGGAATNDFSPAPSTQEFIYGVNDSPYTFRTSAAAVADVQAWLDHPETNYGWLLKPLDEAPNFTARRFAAREDEAQAPALQVTFLVPPVLALARTNAQARLAFLAQPGQGYTLESAPDPAGPWTTLLTVDPPVSETNVVHLDAGGGERKFYRTRSP